MAGRVIVLGGGVAGMSAAHELSDRGFEVVVLETRDEVGGKARSFPFPGSAEGGRPPLPGEHGFRFFPGFYRHLPDTMRRIPHGGRTVFHNLVAASEVQIASKEGEELLAPVHLPRNLADTVAVYAILLVVAIVALLPLRAPDEVVEPVKFAGQAPVAAQQESDASSAER